MSPRMRLPASVSAKAELEMKATDSVAAARRLIEPSLTTNSRLSTPDRLPGQVNADPHRAARERDVLDLLVRDVAEVVALDENLQDAAVRFEQLVAEPRLEEP